MVSIIIPVYNTAKYLRQAIDSVIKQTHQNLQIICVNDGSTDQSLAILEEYANKDARIEVITQENSGLSAARNRGLKSVKGDYVLFLDSDDWLDTDTVAKARRYLIDNNVDIVFWGYIKEYENSAIPVRVWNQNITFTDGNMQKLTIRLVGQINQELRNPALLDSIGTAWGKLYKTSLFSHTRFTDTQIIGSAEDVLCNIEIFSKAKSAFYTTDITHHYRKNNSQSLTKAYKSELISQWQNLFDYMHELIIKYKMHRSAEIALENRKALAVIGLGLNELDAGESFIPRVKRIKALLSIPWLRSALKQIPLTYFPIHWKLFFYFTKEKMAIPSTLLLLAIKKIISK